MSASATFPGHGGYGVRGGVAFWLTGAAVALAAHATVVTLALHQPASPPAESPAPPAITIDLAPVATAPLASEQQIAPDTHDALEVKLDTPEPTPPLPTVEPPREDAAELPPPDLTLQPVDEPPPTVQPEVALPDPAPTVPRPMQRPETLPKPPEPEVAETRRPPQRAPSEAAARAQVRTEAADAAATPQASTAGARGMSPARWQAKLMAHLERLKRYPTSARRRREEGVVQVRFVIDDAGNVRSAHIVRSSGYPDLDEAVVALVHRASPVPAPPPGAPRDIVAPVVFNVR